MWCDINTLRLHHRSKRIKYKHIKYKSMSTTFKSQMKEVMSMAWSFVRKNGYSMSEALKCAWEAQSSLESKGSRVLLQKDRWYVTSSLWHSQRESNR